MTTLLSKFNSLQEARDVNNPDITYTDTNDNNLDKVTAVLKSRDSEAYTKLAYKLERIEQLSKEIEKYRKEVKEDTRVYIADLFNADDVTRTRVVETVSVIFQMTKNPKETNTPQYAKILAELTKSLTPELINVMEAIKKKYTTVVQKSPALSYERKPKNESVVYEGFSDTWQAIKQSMRDMLVVITRWAARYDAKLQDIRDQLD